MPIQNTAAQIELSLSSESSENAFSNTSANTLMSRVQLEAQLTEWCRDGHPTENRIEAKNRILQYITHSSSTSSRAADTLDLSNLGLRAVVSQHGTSGLPLCLANLHHLAPKLRRLDLSNNAYRFVPDAVIQMPRRMQVDLNNNPFEVGALDLARREIAYNVAQSQRSTIVSQPTSQAPDPDLQMARLAQQLATVGLARAETLPVQIDGIEDTHYDRVQVMRMARAQYLKNRVPDDNKGVVMNRIETCFEAQTTSPGSAEATQLDLSWLDLSELPDCFHLLKPLLTLNLSGNDFSQKRSLPVGIAELQNLEYLQVQHCDIRDVPSTLGALPSGCVVDLRNNPLNSTAQMSFNVAKALSMSLPLEAGPSYVFDNAQIAENCPAPAALQAIDNWKARAKESLDANNIKDLNALIEVLGPEGTQALNTFLLDLEQIPNGEYPTEDLVDQVNHLIDFLMTEDGRSHNRIVELIQHLPNTPTGLLIGLSDCLAVANSLEHFSGDELTIQEFIHNSRGMYAYLNLRALCKSVVRSFNIPNEPEFTINCIRRLNQQHPLDLIATGSSVPSSAPHQQLLEQTVQQVLNPVAGEKIAMKLVMQGNWGHIVQTRLPELFAVYKANVQERLLALVERGGVRSINDGETNRIRRNGLYEITDQYLRETGY